jgi:hypothetical protein
MSIYHRIMAIFRFIGKIAKQHIIKPVPEKTLTLSLDLVSASIFVSACILHLCYILNKDILLVTKFIISV